MAFSKKKLKFRTNFFVFLHLIFFLRKTKDLYIMQKRILLAPIVGTFLSLLYGFPHHVVFGFLPSGTTQLAISQQLCKEDPSNGLVDTLFLEKWNDKKMAQFSFSNDITHFRAQSTNTVNDKRNRPAQYDLCSSLCPFAHVLLKHPL